MGIQRRNTTTNSLNQANIINGADNTTRITKFTNLEFQAGSGAGGFITVFSGGINSGTYDKPVATTALQQYIDASVKPDYIENFMNDNLSDLKSKIDASHNSIITTITDFSMDGASSYLANFALSTIGVVQKAYLISQDHAEIIKELDELKIECEAFIAAKAAQQTSAPLMGDLTVDTVFDMKYILYIQTYGIPPLGVFDPVKLAQFL